MILLTKRFVSALMILGLCSACASRQAIQIGQIPQATPPSLQQKNITRSAIQKTLGDKGYDLFQSGEVYTRVRSILNRIEIAAGIPKGTYPLFIADAGEDVNASAFNNSSIVVYEALSRKVESDDELATVIAHEVAHILAKHVDDDSSEERAESVSMGSYLLGTVASVAASYAGVDYTTARSAGQLASKTTSIIGQGALVRSYDRKLEAEADHVGLMLMAKAGFDPHAAISFWSKSEEIFGSKSGLSFFSTHPSGDDRVANLKEALPYAIELSKK